MPVHEKILKQECYMKTAKGKRSLLKFARGERLSHAEAIRAKCYECQAYYEDIASVRDCGIRDCPLYPFHPYSADRSQNKPVMTMKERMAEEGWSFGGFMKKKEDAEELKKEEPEEE